VALSDQELIALLTDLESDRVERKESAANSDRLSEAICAFANDMPGYGEPGVLSVGVSDNGAVLGRPITDELLRQLADLRDQGTILPPPTMTVRTLRVDGGELAVVEVQPSAAPPVRFKGRVYIRVGPWCAIASLDRARRAFRPLREFSPSGWTRWGLSRARMCSFSVSTVTGWTHRSKTRSGSMARCSTCCASLTRCSN